MLSLLLVPVLTRSLSPEVYGAWTQLVVLSSLFSQVAGLGLYYAGLRFLAGREESGYVSSLLHGILAVALLNSLALAIALITLSAPLAYLFFGEAGFSGFVQALGVVVGADLMLDFALLALRARQRTGLLSFYLLIRYTGRIAVLALGLAWFHAPFLALLFIAAGLQLLLFVWVYWWHLLRTWGFAWSFQLVPWRALLAFGLPSAASSLLLWVNNAADRFLIVHLLSLKEVAIYALANSLVSVISLVGAVIVFTLYPALASYYNQGRPDQAHRALSHVLAVYLVIALPAAAVVSLGGQQAIRLLATEAYVAPWPVLLWLSLGAVVFGLYSIYNCGLLVLARTMTHLRVTALAAAVNVIVLCILVPSTGIEGAALATLTSNLVLAAAVFWRVRNQEPALAPIPFAAHP